MKYTYTKCLTNVFYTDPPRITAHPKELKDAVPDKFAMLTVQGTGTEPLSYQWQHEIKWGGGEWRSCDVEKFPGANSSTSFPVCRSQMKGAIAALSAMLRVD